MAEPGRYTLLSRPDCHLCEEFMLALRATAPAISVHTIEADVDSRADWKQRFGLRIPVLIDGNGAVVCEGRFDPRKLARYV